MSVRCVYVSVCEMCVCEVCVYVKGMCELYDMSVRSVCEVCVCEVCEVYTCVMGMCIRCVCL